MTTGALWPAVLTGVTFVVIWRFGRWLRRDAGAWAENLERRMSEGDTGHPASVKTKLQLGPPVVPGFHIEKDAVRYLAETGRRFYIWEHAVGGTFSALESSVDEPALEDVNFIRYEPGEDLEVFVAETIPPPGEWRLTYHRFPHRHVRANYDDGTSKALSLSGGSGGP
jgi:hypothetical protein